jgi:tRNA A-37 threonylcarbamoyl transferase component Bud32
MEVIGEGFESVVLKVRCEAGGDMFVLKLGKLRLEENYRALQPMLAAIQATGLSVAQYLLYDTFLNGILMEYLEGYTFAACIEQMEKKRRSLPELLTIYARCLHTLIALHGPHLCLSHGDAHDENWLVNGDDPVLIDFRYSPTISFTSERYRHRDTFAMLCTLYRLLYGKYPRNRQAVKHAIMQQSFYRHEEPNDFPQLHQGNRYDELFQYFLSCSVYNPQKCTLKAIAQMVAIYISGFQALQ